MPHVVTAASPATLLQRAANNIRNLSSACSLPAEALKAALRAGIGAGDTCNGEHRKLKEIMKLWPRKNLRNKEVATNPKGHLLLRDLTGNSLTKCCPSLRQAALVFCQRLTDSHPSWVQRTCSSLTPSGSLFWPLLYPRFHN